MEHTPLEGNEEYWKQELEKCKADPMYFYYNYWLIDGKKPVVRDVNRITEPFDDDVVFVKRGREGNHYIFHHLNGKEDAKDGAQSSD